MADMTHDEIISALRSIPFGVGAAAADLIIAQAAEIARLKAAQPTDEQLDHAFDVYRGCLWRLILGAENCMDDHCNDFRGSSCLCQQKFDRIAEYAGYRTIIEARKDAK